ncbi:hypothetical protein HPB47_015628 [Ixodes persulcatus]|uniref:Uncharacterized protein n=1 Tax=Ixodes persulcatus TaxID=34615 RepID=A0AC60QWK1_IXOPE|nr:hypothetical protein HPB47_015628 [Ixodes persulcatus]
MEGKLPELGWTELQFTSLGWYDFMMQVLRMLHTLKQRQQQQSEQLALLANMLDRVLPAPTEPLVVAPLKDLEEFLAYEKVLAASDEKKLQLKRPDYARELETSNWLQLCDSLRGQLRTAMVPEKSGDPSNEDEARKSQTGQFEARKPFLCFNCQEPGHIAARCNKPRVMFSYVNGSDSFFVPIFTSSR